MLITFLYNGRRRTRGHRLNFYVCKFRKKRPHKKPPHAAGGPKQTFLRVQALEPVEFVVPVFAKPVLERDFPLFLLAHRHEVCLMTVEPPAGVCKQHDRNTHHAHELDYKNQEFTISKQGHFNPFPLSPINNRQTSKTGAKYRYISLGHCDKNPIRFFQNAYSTHKVKKFVRREA